MKQKITILLFLGCITMAFFWACQDEELPEVTGNNKIELTITEDSTSYVFAEITCALNQQPNFAIEQHGFCWDTIIGVTIENLSNSFGILNGQNFTENIETLLPNKIYYVKAYIQNGDVVIYSNELTIYTLDARPIVRTNDITNILGNSAESGGTVNAYEALFPITQRGICWAKTTSPTIADSLTINGTGNGTFNNEMLNLDVGINYYVRAFAINSEGISYGEEKTFETLDGIPELTTDSIRNITPISATFYGNIIGNDGLEILEKGFCWNINTNPTTANNFQVVTGSTLGSFNAGITGLAVNSTFYVKVYVKNEAGTFYDDEEISFTTEDGLPHGLVTAPISDTTAISAMSGGSISDDGGFPITVKGVCWSTNPTPTIADLLTTDGTGVGSFTSSLTGLDVNTTYYLRSYATNATGTVYGNELSFTTEDGLPSGLTTTEVTDITDTTATSGGNITDDGGFAITARGVCWSTNTNPVITDAHTTDGTGTGSFTSSLTDLTEWTTYYVRAYATNSYGTAYGNEVSFTIIGTTVSDYDGNVYGVVQIGNQIWMAENLKTTHYADGTAIPLVTDNTAWANLDDNNTDDAYCYYNNDVNSQYGALYTWAAAMNGAASSTANPSGIQGACPDGWHLPSGAEEMELVNYLGGVSIAGGKMKETGTIHWSSPNTGATNESGFSALPGGGRDYGDGSFIDAGYIGIWCYSEEYSSTRAPFLGLIYESAEVGGDFRNKSFGFSVRCLKD